MVRCASLFSQLVALFSRSHFYQLVRKQALNITLKDNADYTVTEENLIPITGNVLRDQLVLLNGFYAQKNCPHVLRRMVVWDSENEREIVLLTNHLRFGANTISAIYKDRWQIELFCGGSEESTSLERP